MKRIALFALFCLAVPTGKSPGPLEGGKILVPWDHDGPSALYALDKLTGKTIWKTPRDEPAGNQASLEANVLFFQ